MTLASKSNNFYSSSCQFLFVVSVSHFSIQHAALSEYRPILACNRLSHSIPAMADRKLTLIPIIFIILRIWSTVRFVLLLTDSPARQNPVLVTLHVRKHDTHTHIFHLLIL